MKVPKKRKLSLSSSSAAQSSAAIIAGNDDLLTEILLLLPARSLVRFKLVNTHWNFLISDKPFRRLHVLNHNRRLKSQPSFILGVRGRSQYFLSRPTVNKLIRFPISSFSDVKILQSCNGLLLLKMKGDNFEYCIFNPTTKDRRPINGISSLPLALYLLFDPSKSPYYRVVGFWGKKSDRLIERCSVFDSATGKWNDDESPSFDCNILDGVSCNDRVYFVRTDPYPSFYYSEEENMCTIPCSPKVGGKKYIMESNGHLHCIHLSFNGNKSFLKIFEMIDNKWLACERIGMYTIDGKSRITRRTTRRVDTTSVELLGMIRTGRIEDSMFLFHVPGQIMIYRFDKECEVLVDYRNDYFYEDHKLQFDFKDAHPFVESFASL